MNETEAIQTIAQFIGWMGLLTLTPFVFRLAYALSYYLTGKLKKRETLIIQFMENGKVVTETEVKLDSKSPLVQQLNDAKKVAR